MKRPLLYVLLVCVVVEVAVAASTVGETQGATLNRQRRQEICPYCNAGVTRAGVRACKAECNRLYPGYPGECVNFQCHCTTEDPYCGAGVQHSGSKECVENCKLQEYKGGQCTNALCVCLDESPHCRPGRIDEAACRAECTLTGFVTGRCSNNDCECSNELLFCGAATPGGGNTICMESCIDHGYMQGQCVNTECSCSMEDPVIERETFNR